MTDFFMAAQIYSLLWILLVNPVIAAENPAVAPNARQEILIQKFIKTVNEKDSKALRGLVHSKNLGCLTTAESFQRTSKMEFRRTIPRERHARIRSISAENLRLLTSWRYPVLPTHAFEIEFGSLAQSVSIVRWIALDGAQWRIIYGCPQSTKIP